MESGIERKSVINLLETAEDQRRRDEEVLRHDRALRYVKDFTHALTVALTMNDTNDTNQ